MTHSTIVREFLRDLYENEELSDISIKCAPPNKEGNIATNEDATFRLHKLVLSTFSPVWRKVFSGDSNISAMELRCDPSALKVILQYIYTGHFHCPREFAKPVKRLVQECEVKLDSVARFELDAADQPLHQADWKCLVCSQDLLEFENVVAHFALHDHIQCRQCQEILLTREQVTNHPMLCVSGHWESEFELDHVYDDDGLLLLREEEADLRVGSEVIRGHPHGARGAKHLARKHLDDFDIAPAAMVMPELILQVADESEGELDEDEESDDDDGVSGRRKKTVEHVSRKTKIEPKVKQASRLPKKLGGREHRKSLRTKMEEQMPKLPGGKVVSGTGNSKKLLCSLCGRTYTGLTAYNRHQLIHAGLKPHKCDVCGKSFTQGQRLTTHMRMHTGERPYLCSLCGKTFTESCKLKRHLGQVHKANKDGNSLIPGQPVIKTEFTKTEDQAPREEKAVKSEMKKVACRKNSQDKKMVKRIKVIKPEKVRKTKSK